VVVVVVVPVVLVLDGGIPGMVRVVDSLVEPWPLLYVDSWVLDTEPSEPMTFSLCVVLRETSGGAVGNGSTVVVVECDMVVCACATPTDNAITIVRALADNNLCI